MLRPSFRLDLRRFGMRLFLLTVGSFLLTVELFLLTIDNFSFFTYNWSFFAYNFSFFAYNWSFFAYSGKVRLIRALRDCKQRSLTVSKKAPTVSKKAAPFFKLSSRNITDAGHWSSSDERCPCAPYRSSLVNFLGILQANKDKNTIRHTKITKLTPKQFRFGNSWPRPQAENRRETRLGLKM